MRLLHLKVHDRWVNWGSRHFPIKEAFSHSWNRANSSLDVWLFHWWKLIFKNTCVVHWLWMTQLVKLFSLTRNFLLSILPLFLANNSYFSFSWWFLWTIFSLLWRSQIWFVYSHLSYSRSMCVKRLLDLWKIVFKDLFRDLLIFKL